MIGNMFKVVLGTGSWLPQIWVDQEVMEQQGRLGCKLQAGHGGTLLQQGPTSQRL